MTQLHIWQKKLSKTHSVGKEIAIWENSYDMSSTLTAMIFLHNWVATKMALEILGYTMGRKNGNLKLTARLGLAEK